MELSPARKGSAASYWAEGFYFPLSLFDSSEAEHHRHQLEAAEATHGPMHYRVKPYLLLRSAADIARHPRLLDAVEAILGPDILLWDSAYIIKEPRDTRYVSWHQDLTYWGLDNDEVVTAWVALTPATPENGCMKMLPGSHRQGRMVHRDTFGADNILHRGQELDTAVDESLAVSVELAAGQASLHHGWTAHGSHPNRSDDRRIGLSLQYISTRNRQRHTQDEHASLVRGADSHGHFHHEPECKEDFAPAMVELQARLEQLKHEVYDTDDTGA